MPELMGADVKYQLDNLHHDLFLEETEDNWEKITKAMAAFMKICATGGYEASPSEVANAFRNSHRPIISAMHSERTRLCAAALDLVSSVANGLGKDFEQLLPLFMPPLLALCGRTNKVVITRARSAISTIVEVNQLVSVLPYFVQNIKDKSATLRLVIAEGTLACLNSCNPPDLEKEARAREIEAVIRGTARDANADVRKVSRKIFESYKILLPSRVESFTAPLSPTMKKYLDIKTNILANQKSTSNLRANLNLNPVVKPSTSTSASTSTAARPNGHTRTASSSTVHTGPAPSQTRNLATSLSRVSRKEPTANVPALAAPVRPVQPARAVSEFQKTEAQRTAASNAGTMRAMTIQETKRPIPPLRSQSSTISRTTATAAPASSTVAPRRLQLNSNPPAPSAPQALASSGPRRVPMAPPPPPAPKKEEAPKRPTSRVDNAASSSRPTVPPAPIRKTASVVSSSLKERAPPVKPPIPKYKPTSSTATTGVTTAASAAGPSSGASTAGTKPLAIAKAKPMWGRSAPAAKPVPAASQKGAAKAVVKKPSTRTIAKPAAGLQRTRPVTPAMVALPPSPTPEEENDKEADVEKEETKEEENVHEAEAKDTEDASEDVSPAASPVPEVEVTAAKVESEQTTQIDNDTQVETPDETQDSTTEENDPTITTSVIAEHTVEQPGLRLPSSNEGLPHTPHGNFLSNPAAAGYASKTPISALLSSIERGFMYSPITPLSPADSYLPGPNGLITYSHQTHAPHVEGPMQAFNYALHAHAGAGRLGANGFGGFKGIGGRQGPQEGMVCGDIGVVGLNEQNNMFMPSSVPGLDDAARLAFVEINNLK